MAIHAHGLLNLFGLGWLMAYGVLSGSPVAAVAVGLFGAGAVRDTEALGMIAGSRFGASFVVLLFGTLHYLRGQRKIITVATGILSLLVTWTIYVPATIIAFLLLVNGQLDIFSVNPPSFLLGLQGSIMQDIVAPAANFLHPLILFIAGVAVMVGAFAVFDRALPEIDPNQGRFRQITDIVYRPKVMFLLGMAVTCVTLSVSVSMGLLVPISAKGYVRRENIIPYIMGANVTTFIDTIIIAMMVGEPRAVSIVLAQIVSVSVVSLIVIVFFYRSYRRVLEATLEAATRSHLAFVVFLAVTMAVPIILLLL